LGSITSGHPLI